jgi:hypothetical protein
VSSIDFKPECSIQVLEKLSGLAFFSLYSCMT